ncbi:hypothetical protein Acr_12g0005210 [Actinidia rufa]|uniref:Uncharacterized protein n=1 Tax=Actinidia rufa TaxID=165716 RepID=A0A7J0FH15_9ERIC|nr:hypothetical protein Acr_12g0005210 [Actinidia rufa]
MERKECCRLHTWRRGTNGAHLQIFELGRVAVSKDGRAGNMHRTFMEVTIMNSWRVVVEKDLPELLNSKNWLIGTERWCLQSNGRSKEGMDLTHGGCLYISRTWQFSGRTVIHGFVGIEEPTATSVQMGSVLAEEDGRRGRWSTRLVNGDHS